MACSGCGRKKPAPRGVTVAYTGSPEVSLRATPTLQLSDVAQPLYNDDQTMVTLEYLGPNVGTETWYGPTGQRYLFGRNSKHIRCLVRIADVEFLLAARLFRVVPRPAAPPPVSLSPVAVATATAIEVTTALDTAPEQPEAVLRPENLSVTEIKALELRPEQWQTLAANELLGKSRVTVLDHAAKQY